MFVLLLSNLPESHEITMEIVLWLPRLLRPLNGGNRAGTRQKVHRQSNGAPLVVLLLLSKPRDETRASDLYRK